MIVDPRRMAPPCCDTTAPERGSGVLGATFGVSVLLMLLMTSSHVLLNLWMRSGIDAVAHDAAMDVATSGAEDDVLPEVRRRALERARIALGGQADRIEMTFEPGPTDEVRLRVVAPDVDLLPPIVSHLAGRSGLDRTIVVRRELPDDGSRP